MTLKTIEFIITGYIFCLGIIIGSYLNVCIYRLPRNISTAKGRSFCPECNHQLHALDLIPIFSYVFLCGKCRYCKSSICLRYPVIEAITGLLLVLVYMRFGFTVQTLLYSLVSCILLVIAVIDIDTMEIHDRMHVLIGIIAGILLYVSAGDMLYHILGALIVSVPLYVLMVISKGGVGGGDIKLMAASGLLLGAFEIVLAMIIGSISAGLIAFLLILTKRRTRKDVIAFGPYLCAGIFISMLYGTHLISWYIGLLS